MKNSLHTIVFALILGAVCSSLLFAVSRFARPYREANEKAERIRNFLVAMEAPLDPQAPAAELLDFFKAHVQREKRPDGLERYEYTPKGKDVATAIAVPFKGSGLWGPVKGVLALEPDMKTIRGIRFYQQEETPGLGGEIASDWFQEQFEGKQILSEAGEPGFHVGEHPGVDDKNVVDGITGATLTSDRVESMLNDLANQLLEKK